MSENHLLKLVGSDVYQSVCHSNMMLNNVYGIK